MAPVGRLSLTRAVRCALIEPYSLQRVVTRPQPSQMRDKRLVESLADLFVVVDNLSTGFE